MFKVKGLSRSINQSINQTSTAPISPMKPGSVVRQPNQCSTVKSRKQFHNINRPRMCKVNYYPNENQNFIIGKVFIYCTWLKTPVHLTPNPAYQTVALYWARWPVAQYHAVRWCTLLMVYLFIVDGVCQIYYCLVAFYLNLLLWNVFLWKIVTKITKDWQRSCATW